MVVSTKGVIATSTNQVDVTPPEPFTLQIAQTPDAFNEQKVLIFAAQDKGSGIARYEVCEGFFAPCVAGESAYTLSRQSADARITVVAYDNAGNTRVEHLYTSAALIRYALYLILAILVGIGAWFLFWRRK
jgi:hypothetical protein